MTQFVFSASAEERKYFIFATVSTIAQDTAVTDYLKHIATSISANIRILVSVLKTVAWLPKDMAEEFGIHPKSLGPTLATFISKYRSIPYTNWFLVGYPRLLTMSCVMNALVRRVRKCHQSAWSGAG